MGRRRSLRTSIVTALLFVLFTWMDSASSRNSCLTMVDASKEAIRMTAFQHALGSWDLSLNPTMLSSLMRSESSRSSSSSVLSQLFPRSDGTVDATRRQGRQLSCRLSLYRNGTFALAPSDRQEVGERMPIQGWWEVKSNPYCLTDRYFDELSLLSYPRTLKQRSSHSDDAEESPMSPEDGSGTEEVALKRAQMELSCRIHGRYFGSYGLAPFFRARHRNPRWLKMNRGVLTWIEDDPTKSQNSTIQRFWKRDASSPHRRRICATFTARRKSLINDLVLMDSGSPELDQETNGLYDGL